LNLLLDTPVILWFPANDPKMSGAARVAILDPGNTRWVSPITLVEIALKNRIGKLPLPDPFGVMSPTSLLAADMATSQPWRRI
jgi:PIN domain nuclease of toxin-antitoxin system